MDLARWLTNKKHPKSVYCVGGRWSEPGAFSTPDTQVVTYEFDDMVMLFEMNTNRIFLTRSATTENPMPTSKKRI